MWSTIFPMFPLAAIFLVAVPSLSLPPHHDLPAKLFYVDDGIQNYENRSDPLQIRDVNQQSSDVLQYFTKEDNKDNSKTVSTTSSADVALDDSTETSKINSSDRKAGENESVTTENSCSEPGEGSATTEDIQDIPVETSTSSNDSATNRTTGPQRSFYMRKLSYKGFIDSGDQNCLNFDCLHIMTPRTYIMPPNPTPMPPNPSVMPPNPNPMPPNPSIMPPCPDFCGPCGCCGYCKSRSLPKSKRYHVSTRRKRSVFRKYWNKRYFADKESLPKSSKSLKKIIDKFGRQRRQVDSDPIADVRMSQVFGPKVEKDKNEVKAIKISSRSDFNARERRQIILSSFRDISDHNLQNTTLAQNLENQETSTFDDLSNTDNQDGKENSDKNSSNGKNRSSDLGFFNSVSDSPIGIHDINVTSGSQIQCSKDSTHLQTSVEDSGETSPGL